ncbi:hypothetical protein [Nocardioides yefusunii]|uniref:Uncharacterized protein n=1 Tax=Nocardioides yefusunii TaxID=2500546 RepID=A0ABW1QZS2_9ACTN|nr:hypothetical protein [Nocardioides yefusunii]
MSTRDEDEAWRAIVENYGDRAVLEDNAVLDDDGPAIARTTATERIADDAASDSAPGTDLQPPARPAFGPQPRPAAPSPEPRPTPPEPAPFQPFAGLPGREEEPAELAPADEADGFVPPVPELPQMERRRLIAWLAVLGAPVAFVLGTVADVNVTGRLGALLALCFIGGLGWLVYSMPGEPQDPWDDGARI